jgi:hypothetical protein
MGVQAEPTLTSAATADRQWFVIERWQEYAGEARANLLRIAGIAAFYIVELINFHGLHIGSINLPVSVDVQFHQKVTALAVAWTMVALATLVCLKLRYFPNWLKYATTLSDVALLTTILLVADGARSPLVVGYFLVIVLATLRFQLSLIWCATVASMVGYLWVAWFPFFTAGLVPNVDLREPVPGYYQLIMLLALAFTGIVLGQVIRRVRTLAEDFSRRVGIQSVSAQAEGRGR